MENNLYPNKRYAKSDIEKQEQGSHGLSKGQLQSVFEGQKAGQEFEQIPANKSNDYLINEHEQFVYHVRITIPHFDSVTGEDQSQTRVDKFAPAMFKQCKDSGVWDGRIVEVLHDPAKIQFKDDKGSFAKKTRKKVL